jgi:hypothetical protein
MKRGMILLALVAVGMTWAADASAIEKWRVETQATKIVNQRMRFLHMSGYATSTRCQVETSTSFFCVVKLMLRGTPQTVYYNVTYNPATDVLRLAMAN